MRLMCPVSVFNAPVDETSVFGCNDDGVVLLVRAQFVQDVRSGHSMLLAALSSL